jgi:cytochrome b pre-mRNA-processing protein 3
MIAPILEAVFRKDPLRSQAERLYGAISEAARAPALFTAAGVADTPEGRFEMLALHMFIAIDRLRRPPASNGRLIRLLQEVFFRRLDDALREMGVGDLSVGRRMRTLAESFYGRVAAYGRGVAGGELEAAIARNVFASADARRGAALAAYLRASSAALAEIADADLAESFANLPVFRLRSAP